MSCAPYDDGLPPSLRQPYLSIAQSSALATAQTACTTLVQSFSNAQPQYQPDKRDISVQTRTNPYKPGLNGRKGQIGHSGRNRTNRDKPPREGVTSGYVWVCTALSCSVWVCHGMSDLGWYGGIAPVFRCSVLVCPFSGGLTSLSIRDQKKAPKLLRAPKRRDRLMRSSQGASASKGARHDHQEQRPRPRPRAGRA